MRQDDTILQICDKIILFQVQDKTNQSYRNKQVGYLF